MLLEAPEHESFLERDAIKLLAMCGDIEAIESQPEVIKYLDDEGEERRYTDLRITLKNDDLPATRGCLTETRAVRKRAREDIPRCFPMHLLGADVRHHYR